MHSNEGTEAPAAVATRPKAWYGVDGGEEQDRYYDVGFGRSEGGRRRRARPPAGDDGSQGLSREDWRSMHVEDVYGRTDERPAS